MLLIPSDPARIIDQIKSLQRRIGGIRSEMTARERLFLYSLTLCLNPRRYLEIGSLEGGSAAIVCAALDTLDNSDGKIYMIDPEFQLADDTWNCIKHRATKIVGKSPDAVSKANELAGGPFDLVLVDGDHQLIPATTDLKTAYEYLTPGGYLLVHDYSYFEVREAVDCILAEGAFIDVGLMCDDTFDGGQIYQGGSHDGKKMLWCGTYVLRKPSRRNIGLSGMQNIAVEARCSELEARNVQLAGELAEAWHKVEMLITSRSWRLTAPLRRVRNIFNSAISKSRAR